MIVAIDDHKIFAAGIELILRREFPGFGFGFFPSLGEAIDQIAEAPKLILLDYRLGGISGAAAVALAKAHWATARIVVLTSEDRDTIARALGGQPDLEIVSKAQPPGELIAAIRRALATTGDHRDRQAHVLSARQIEMLRYLREGHSNKAIAKLSNLSEFTVRGHLQQIYKMLGASNRTSAVYLAEQARLI